MKKRASADSGDPLSVAQQFNMLSLKDVVEARDHYHVHLIHKENVVATAVGRYLIRTDTKDTDAMTSGLGRTVTQNRGPRTLGNSEVRPYSWPCVLVFVEQWVLPHEFGNPQKPHPDSMVPRALYMPDGRVVPVCVVQVERITSAPGPIRNLTFPENLIGGGYPVLVDVQGEEHVGSVGCLVSDGHLVYALTNRHVAGRPGEPVYAILGGRKVEIGKTSDKQLTRLPFQDVYSEWPGKNVYVNLDIGLIEIADKAQWTAQIYGIGMMGHLADLSKENLSLKLIGCPVRGYGAASREMRGEIRALFYRYKSVGGFEYVADFLIGERTHLRKTRAGKPRDAIPFDTHPGDSGTLWLLENPHEVSGPMPIAVQWGGHVFADQGGASRLPFALATGLSTVLDRLQVDPIPDWNVGHDEYWGAVGHYTIANKACDAIANKNLKKLMAANLNNITFPDGDITQKGLSGLSKHHFIPLADVPDLAWKIGKNNRGQPEHPNHFADMDKPNPKDGGKTMLDLCKGHPENVAVAVWQKYYDDVGDQDRGLLPFRAWQFYQGMVEFVKAGKVEEFVCAAGILSHYVGDACQPLHISYMFNGDPSHPVTTTFRDRKRGMVTEPAPRGLGVHAVYEDGMVDAHTAEILAGVDKLLPGKTSTPPPVVTGHDAAVAVVDLMQNTFARISPGDIVDAFVKAGGKPSQAATSALWSQFGADTIAVIADGCRYLAHLWDAAWKAGGGDQTIKTLTAIDPEKLLALYSDHSFMPSKTLDQISPLLAGTGTSTAPTAGANGRSSTARGHAPKRTPRPKKPAANGRSAGRRR